MKREIAVIRREILFSQDNYFQGFLPRGRENFLSGILNNFEFKERDDVEKNPEFQQPIPYVWIINPTTKKIFAYQRAADKNYNEPRLRKKWSCGIGGHIDKQEIWQENLLIDSMMRELKEEVYMKKYPAPKIIGYINDDSNDVGKVHFGIVALAETEGEVNKGDDEMAHGQSYSINELEEIFSNPENEIESWTEISWPFIKSYIENLP